MSPLPSPTNTSGLSVALFNSTAAISRACASESRTAPCTCGVQRKLYASCTRASFSAERWDSRIWLPSFKCARLRAVIAAPVYGRACMMRASKAPGLPRSASSDKAAATSAVSTSVSASRSARLSNASIPCVPLSSDSPSLASSATGVTPARRMASAPASVSPRYAARPSPITTCARCASGAKSPDAPTEPCDGITGCTPAIPSQGSVGASGDLAPLAHLAHVVIGEGRAAYRGETLAGAEAMRRAGVTPVALDAKEGLSLLNGTQGMLALLSLALRDADTLVDTADVAAALSLDALRGSPGAFDARIMHARPYTGAAMTARNLAHLNEGSQIRESHRSAEKDARVQDAYSLRCTPQVHGAVRDSLAQAREMAAVELNSATDNPLVFVGDGSGDIISGGNFHWQPLAMAPDQAALAIATLAGIFVSSGEQIAHTRPATLLPFLTPEPGINSGFM